MQLLTNIHKTKYTQSKSGSSFYFSHSLFSLKMKINGTTCSQHWTDCHNEQLWVLREGLTWSFFVCVKPVFQNENENENVSFESASGYNLHAASTKTFIQLDPWSQYWPTSKFSLQSHYLIKHTGHEIKRKHHQR